MRTNLTYLLFGLAVSIAFPGYAAEADTQTMSKTSKPTAASLRQAAHDAREVWHNFPGFTANIVVSEDSQRYEGTIRVGKDFEYVLDIPKEAKKPWLKSKLRSVIGHREPHAVPERYDVSFQEDSEPHAGGRVIVENDGSGVFRIQDGQIKEIIRRNESSWFEITTLENFTTPDGKVLPQTTSVTFRDPDTGNIESNLSNYFAWKKVGDFYLPGHCYTVKTGEKGERSIRKLDFSDHQLHLGEPSVVKMHKPLPESLTSFGAAVLGEYLYVFSGHDGDSHGFGKDVLADHFRRIKFDDPDAQWEELARQEPAQSTALVTDGKFVYRIGGLTFLNQGDEETHFKSTTHFGRYDVEKDVWTDLAPLPEPRSSLDAAVLGRHIYVAGGWDLQGESSRNAPWHDDILRLDLDHPEQGWESLPGPGYKTRAVSVAAHDGKLYLFGGIQPTGISRRVSVFDPKSKSWSVGPELKPDSSTAGFATSSFAAGDHLYVTGGSGIVYRLSDDGTDWKVETRLMYPRMFLRLLPVSENRLLALGGTSMLGGRLAAVESVPVQTDSPGPNVVRWSVPFDGKAKQSQTLVLDGTQLYAFGGNASRQPHNFTKETIVDEAFVFDIANQTGERLPDMPHALQSGAAVRHAQTSEHKQLLVLGGLGMPDEKFGSLSQVLTFNPESKDWTTASIKLPTPRGMFEAISHDDAIWCFGGSEAGKGSGLNANVLHWWGDETSAAPLPEVALPTPRRSFGGARIGDEYFLVGGLGDDGIVETVDVFHFQDRTWRTIPAPHKHRVFPSLASDGKRLYLYGGFSNSQGHFSPETSLEVYDAKADRWTVLAEELPEIDSSMAMFNFGGRLLFYGIDREVDGQANFVLLDPNPREAPAEINGTNFSRRRRSSETETTAKTMMRKDTNKDGKLSAEELGDRLASLIQTGDEDQDGLLTREELIAALDKQEEKADEKPPEENKDDA